MHITLIIASIDIAPGLLMAMFYASISTLGKAQVIWVSALIFYKIGKPRGCSTILASIITTLDIHG
jgi:hypothetical protein